MVTGYSPVENTGRKQHQGGHHWCTSCLQALDGLSQWVNVRGAVTVLRILEKAAVNGCFD